MQVLLDIKNIKKIYRSKEKVHEALKGVSFSLYAGEVFGLLGVNGAGKTTLSSIIATLHPPTEGDILFQGKSIYSNVTRYRKHLGFCPQKPNFEKLLTVEENLLFAGRYYGLSFEEIKKRAHYLMERFELSPYAHSSPDILSGGYKQRLLIARALIHKPALIILDEPTSAMDPHIRRELWELIRSLKAEGVTILLTTHYLDEAELLSDRVCILDKGLIRALDTPENLKSAYNKSKLEDVFLHLVEETKAAK